MLKRNIILAIQMVDKCKLHYFFVTVQRFIHTPKSPLFRGDLDIFACNPL